jgi:cyclopropane fatty-acyl-phospholipid synthase-like methyltransferase
MRFIEDVRGRVQIAELTEKANEQHYEVPFLFFFFRSDLSYLCRPRKVSTKFILSTLGPYAKYSSCLYPTGKETLAEAEILMLESYCRKAQMEDGQDVLDLGCGWGSLSLFLAQKYPNSHITGLSNSSTQKAHIDATAKAQGLSNLEVCLQLSPAFKSHNFIGRF